MSLEISRVTLTTTAAQIASASGKTRVRIVSLGGAGQAFIGKDNTVTSTTGGYVPPTETLVAKIFADGVELQSGEELWGVSDERGGR